MPQAAKTVMSWQLILVVLIVTVAVLYLVRQTWRAWSPRKGACGGGCSCPGKSAAPAEENGVSATLIPAEQLTLRRRRDP
jgi:hypothetical protein